MKFLNVFNGDTELIKCRGFYFLVKFEQNSNVIQVFFTDLMYILGYCPVGE